MKTIQLGLFSAGTLASVALTLFMALGPVAPPAKAQTWSTGTWSSADKTCTCPTFYAGCKCVISQ